MIYLPLARIYIYLVISESKTGATERRTRTKVQMCGCETFRFLLHSRVLTVHGAWIDLDACMTIKLVHCSDK